MSYDLDVYVPMALEPSALRAMLADAPGLAPADDGEILGSLIAVRGARRRYCFTIDGPAAVEPEDVPEAVTAAVLGVRHLYSVVVEGSAQSDIPHAVRFARRMAKDLDGAVVDRQIDDVWSKSRTRSIEKPAREERVDVVDVDIYCVREALIPEPRSCSHERRNDSSPRRSRAGSESTSRSKASLPRQGSTASATRGPVRHRCCS